MADGTHIVRRSIGRHKAGQVVDPSGWRWKRLHMQDGRIEPYGGEVYRAADGTEWSSRRLMERRNGELGETGEEPSESYEFTEAAEAVILGAGFALEDYDGAATGATGSVLKSDAEAWTEAQ